MSFADATVSRFAVGEIQPGFWVGGVSALKEIPKIQTRGDASGGDDEETKCVWSIVSIVQAPKLIQFCQDQVRELRETHGICVDRHEEWVMADKNDSPLLGDRLVEILQIMDESLSSSSSNSAQNNDQRDGHDNRHLLVHCAFGVSRSVSVCAAWLMSRKGLSLEKAMQTIRAARPDAMPNLGFVANLKTIEQSNGDIQKALQRKEELRQASSSAS